MSEMDILPEPDDMCAVAPVSMYHWSDGCCSVIALRELAMLCVMSGMSKTAVPDDGVDGGDECLRLWSSGGERR